MYKLVKTQNVYENYYIKVRSIFRKELNVSLEEKLIYTYLRTVPKKKNIISIT